VQDKPYALFGTCLGAITAYEVAQRAVAKGLPGPVAFFPAAVSPPHLYAQAVMKLYLADGTKADSNSMDMVMGKLRGWRDLPREMLMMVSISAEGLSSNSSFSIISPGKQKSGAEIGDLPTRLASNLIVFVVLDKVRTCFTL
jgi:hypothetical protein